ncbi:MAG: hypothetical protein KGV59_07335 [Tenacibaculum sp.]|nr:hypothetical protein [Tenacibaculum sp.]
MKAKDYLKQKFASVGLTLTDADLLDLGVDAETEVTNSEDLYKKFIQFIPNLLLRPVAISEGGTSISRAKSEDIKAFYSTECKRLGLKNEIKEEESETRVIKPKVKFL